MMIPRYYNIGGVFVGEMLMRDIWRILAAIRAARGASSTNGKATLVSAGIDSTMGLRPQVRR